MEIASRSGLIQSMTRGIQPFITFLFPVSPKTTPPDSTYPQISSRISSVSAGPALPRAEGHGRAGKAEEDRRSGKAAGTARPKGTAGNEMCTFLIINISSLQLIPVNVIAYRSQYGSAAPASIVGAGILATAVSTAVAVFL